MNDAIENASALEAVFGEWPSFHDAEVLRAVLDRSGDDGPTLLLAIHVFDMTSEVDSKGFFVLKNHTEVHLTFLGVELTYLRWFNHQNVLSSLEIERLETGHDARSRFRVELPSSYGLESLFECDRIVVSEVKPYVEP